MLRRAKRPPWVKPRSVANAAAAASRMPIVGSARAKVAYLEVEKTDKIGRKFVGRDEITISQGMYSAREAQRDIDRAVEHSEYKVLDAVVETYEDGEVPALGPISRQAEDGQRGFSYGGFGGGAWPPESPRVRAMQARREEPA